MKRRVTENNSFLYILVDMEGREHRITASDFESSPLFSRSDPAYALLKRFVANELGRGGTREAPSKHIDYMRRHELLDYCDASEKGHFKWFPKGVLIRKLLLDYASRLARDWGAVEMNNPVIIRGDQNVVGELMGEFHERDYKVDGGRGICYLRYASDPLAFPFMNKVRFSYKQSPLRVYEEASCFRNEQQGEVSGLRRVRNFLMTDMHAACADPEEARVEFENLCLLFARLMNEVIAGGRWVLGWEGIVSFYEENRDWLARVGRAAGAPSFFKLMPEMKHYYAMKNEYQAITEDGANVQISTVQWDVKDGPRFDIGFFDEEGRKHPCPVIIHASSFGSVERALCAILENIALEASRGAAPAFPLWLAPTQVRIAPVSRDYESPASALRDRIARRKVRADLDDRDVTVGKKIRDAEREWVPYVIVFGGKEASSGRLAVRCRGKGAVEEMSLGSLVGRIRRRAGAMPFRPLPLPERLTGRPSFL